MDPIAVYASVPPHIGEVILQLVLRKCAKPAFLKKDRAPELLAHPFINVYPKSRCHEYSRDQEPVERCEGAIEAEIYDALRRRPDATIRP